MSCCNTTFNALGQPNCKIDFGAIKHIAFTIDQNITDFSLQTYINNGTMVVTPKLYNVTADKAESTFQEFEDGTRFFIREGIRTITAIIPKPTYNQLGQFKRLRCKGGLHALFLDGNGNILGLDAFLSSPPALKPIPVENETVDAILGFATDTTVPQISLTLQLSQTVKEEEYAIAQLPSGTSPSLLVKVPVYYNGALSNTINLTANTFSLSLYAYNNYLTYTPFVNYLTDKDFSSAAPNLIITGKIIATMATFTLNCQVTSYGAGLISGTILSAVGVASGDSVYIETITPLHPYSNFIANPGQAILVT